MQRDNVADYNIADCWKTDDSCFENPLTSHDVEAVKEVVKNIEKVSKDFQ